MNGAQIVVAGLSGLIFGFGLALSGMLDPARVRGFLDVFGAWDPSLAFVLGGAVAAASIGVWLSRRLPRPAFDQSFHLPKSRTIDGKLVAGAAIFGVGWGMAGLCPGPAVASITLGVPATLLFLAAMLAGMAIHDRATIRFFHRDQPIRG
ncbi:YeeE/YedE family protein [Hansschlegelia zhihuaiae]|uniref:YeeE/YedE family protein n=1 Tax=Hansschlegelia zhihuaiae TaxID=405005 RepID=A0A4Q0MNU6_9HYPH|nr:YeeE/YedE family protein [Hansschlegelia zhihuaiae]RXF75567.1 YeeE/YedE family protein [Hansschlegelia zhihuaiae]